jgi:hypothetical protein
MGEDDGPTTPTRKGYVCNKLIYVGFGSMCSCRKVEVLVPTTPSSQSVSRYLAPVGIYFYELTFGFQSAQTNDVC